MRKTKWPGEWKVVCHVCGWQYPSSEIRKRWDGFLVCKKDWEPRHPADFFRIKGETETPPFTSPEPEDVFTSVTYPFPLDDPTH